MGRRLQWRAASLLAEIPDTGGLRCHIHRNGRSAAQPRPASPLARCSTRATRRTTHSDSKCCWMKLWWQVKGPRWRADRPYHVTVEDRYIREHWDEIHALCKLNSLPFNATGKVIN